MLTFCEKCGNLMSLKEKDGSKGLYECRSCSSTILMKVEKLVFTEKILEEPPIGPIQKEIKFLV